MSHSETIRLPNRFDYAYHREFSAACQPVLETISFKEVTLDFTLVDYMDSSALGMMVLLQKRLAAKSINVKIAGARGATREILIMANMQNIFEFI